MFLLLAKGNISSVMAVRRPGIIALFDVDGTLTAPRKVKKNLLVDLGSMIVIISVFITSFLCIAFHIFSIRKVLVHFQVATPELLKFMGELRKVPDLLHEVKYLYITSFFFYICIPPTLTINLILLNTAGCYSWCCGRI